MNDQVLSCEQALEKANNQSLIFIDIRRIDEWQTTGVPQGAYPVTMDNPEFLTIIKKLSNNDYDAPIGIICAAGGRSARICQVLQMYGYNFIFDIAEGVNGGPHGVGWLEKKLPVVAYEEAIKLLL
jgi:rhodanese-related sulfurtransferase